MKKVLKTRRYALRKPYKPPDLRRFALIYADSIKKFVLSLCILETVN